MSKVCGRISAHPHQAWRHNGLLGQCKRAEVAMQAIYDAETTTDECRELASKIEGQIKVLYQKLHTRRDQQHAK